MAPSPYLIISSGIVFEVEFLPQEEEIYISRHALPPEPSIFVRRLRIEAAGIARHRRARRVRQRKAGAP